MTTNKRKLWLKRSLAVLVAICIMSSSYPFSTLADQYNYQTTNENPLIPSLDENYDENANIEIKTAESSTQYYAYTSAEKQPKSFTERDKKEILVKYKDQSKSSQIINSVKNNIKPDRLDSLKKLRTEKVELFEIGDQDNINQLINELRKNENVEYAQPNYKLYTNAIMDLRFEEQWGLLNNGQAVSGQAGAPGVDINATMAWEITSGSSSVAVGILDTGIDINHIDLQNNIFINTGEIPGNGIDDDFNGYVDDINGWDFYNSDNSVFDSVYDDMHGTHVAGIMAAEANNDGIRGVAPGVKILPLKFISGGFGYTSDAIEAIEYAGAMGIKIINCSWGGTDDNPALYDAMAASNILFVCAAGNSAGDIIYNPLYPASFGLPNTISVAALDNTGTLASFSSYGTSVNVAAPGSNILSTLPDNNYGMLSGTSMAAPHVTGIAALLFSNNPSISVSEAKAIIEQNTKALSGLEGKVATGGIADANKALGGSAEPVDDTLPQLAKEEIIKINNSIHEDPEIGRVVARQLLSSGDPEIRKYAVQVLGEIGGGEELSYLYTLSENDPLDEIKGQAAVSMEKIYLRGYEAEDEKLKVIELQLKSPFNQVRDFAVYQLSRMDSEEARILAGQALSEETDPNRISVLQSIYTQNTLTNLSALSYPRDSIEGLIHLLSYDRQGDNQSINPGSSATVSCKLYSAQSKVEISVWNNYGERVASSTKGPYTANQTISYTWYTNSNTEPGWYTIHFHYPDNGTSQYDDYFYIYVKEPAPPPPANDPYENNNSRATATRIYLGNTYNAYIQVENDVDYYYFTSDSSGKLSFNMSVPSGVDYDVSLLNSNGVRLTGSYGTGRSESFTYNIIGGNTYYIFVESCEGYGNQQYSFYTSFEPVLRDVNEPNDDTTSATVIGLNSSRSAYIDYRGDQDFYKIIPTQSGQITFNMTIPQGTDYRAWLMDGVSYDSLVASKGPSDGSYTNESFSYDLISGRTYYIRVFGYNGSCNGDASYSFNVSFTAVQMASLTIELTGDDYVRSGDNFWITARVKNTTSFVATNVVAEINIPAELQLASGENIQKSLDSIPASSYKEVSWQLIAGSVSSDTSRTIYVTAQGSNTDSSSQSKNITIYNPTISGLGGTNAIAQVEPNDIDRSSLISDPVDASTGAYMIDKNLLSVKGAQAINFKVQYNSLLLKEGIMGRGWGHAFEASLEILDNYTVNVKWNANRANRFNSTDGIVFTSTDLSYQYDKLEKEADGSYALTRSDQSSYIFNSAGKLIELKNGHGQSLTMTYDGSGRISAVAEPVSGQALVFGYNQDGLLQSVSDNLNRQIAFSYDASHNLTGITDANGKTTTYTYNQNGQILTGTDAGGVRFLSNTYDQQGRVVYQDDANPANQLTGLSYDESSEPGNIITTVTDRNGQVKVLTHDSNYKLKKEIDELGGDTNYTYDAGGNRTSITDSGSRVTNYTYDTSGNVLTATDPAGHVTTMAYDDRNNPLSVQNPAGKITTYQYDGNNNPVRVTNPLGDITTCSYDSNGFLVSKTSPRTGTTTYSYQNGLLRTVTDPEGISTTYSYDAAGRLTGIADGAGNTTSYTYDNADNLLTATDPLGHQKSFTYDLHGHKLTETDTRGNVTRFTYDGNGNLLTRVDALNNMTTYQYDGEERLIKVKDARGNTTNMGYDSKGRLVSVTDPLGNTTTTIYDTMDRPVEKKDAYGVSVETISYNLLDNPLSITDALGRTVTKQYDNLNRLTSVTDPLGHVTSYAYDDLNRVISITSPLQKQGGQNFDADGNRASVTDLNNNTTTFTYDLAGRLTQKTNQSGNVVAYTYNNRGLLGTLVNGRGQVTNFQYDSAGRITGFTDPAGTVSYTYDANGNVLTETDGSGTITREYDALNRLTKYTNPRGNIIRYEYDAVGNLVTMTYPGEKEVQYEYDAANHLTSVTDWAERVTTYEYDNNGRVVKTTRPNGTEATNSYDAAGQLTQLIDLDANSNYILQYDYIYDDVGNLAEEINTENLHPLTIPEISLAYGSDNRPITYNGSNQINHDADGNMTAGPLYRQGVIQTANFTYDARNRLTAVDDTTYLYDAENNRIGVNENGIQYDYVIDPNAALSQALVRTGPSGEQTFYVYGLGLLGQEEDGVYLNYHYDRQGSTAALTDMDGSVVERFQYSPEGNLGYRSGSTSTPFLYLGQYGVMTDANGLNYMRARYYSPLMDRFINEDTFDGRYDDLLNLNLYVYCKNNPVIFIDPEGQNWLSTTLSAVGLAATTVAMVATAPVVVTAAVAVGLAVSTIAIGYTAYEYATGEIGPGEAAFNVATNLPGVGVGLRIGGEALEIAGFAVSHVNTVLDLAQTASGTSIFHSQDNTDSYDYYLREEEGDNLK